MTMEEQLVADVYESQCELARARGEEPPPCNRAFADAVMDVYLEPDGDHFPGQDPEAVRFFRAMVWRHAS